MSSALKTLILAFLATLPSPSIAQAAHPQASPFIATDAATAGIDSALATVANTDKKVIIVMGANWCHDSRALAGWFATSRFTAMLHDRYAVVYVDVGTPQTGNGRNLDIASRFGIKKVKSTPLVMIVSPDGTLLNGKKDAARWRNAASRSEDAIFDYFEDFVPRL